EERAPHGARPLRRGAEAVNRGAVRGRIEPRDSGPVLLCQRVRTKMRPTMSQSVSEVRASASKVARFLVAKNRQAEAVSLLSAWAVAGPNDPEGQGLLAEALQIDARSTVSKMAFERMEGIAGDHAELDEAIAKYDEAEVARLDKELTKPAFQRAQVGFNNNLKYK